MYAPAYEGMAQGYVLLPYYGGTPANEGVSKAKSATEHALRLNKTLAEAHATLAVIESGRLNWSAARPQYQRALHLDPNYATAHQWYSFLLWMTGQHDQALEEIEHARELDPLSLIIHADEGRLLCVAH